MEISGEVKSILFFNEANSYTVAKIETKDQDIIITGNCPKLVIGEEILVKGSFIEHAKYGEQFIIESCQKILPSSEQGMIIYLSSGIIKGIGRLLAEKMVKRFGKDLFNIIETDPDQLLEIDKLGEKKLQTIIESFKENKDIQDIIVYLNSYNIGYNLAMKIYHFFRNETRSIVENNPYKLVNIRGVGFKLADEIALKVGIDEFSQMRIREGIKYIFNLLINNNGHTLLNTDSILKYFKKILNIDINVSSVLNEMSLSNEIKHIHYLGQDYYTLLLVYQLENKIYNKIKTFNDHDFYMNYDFGSIQKLIEDQFPTISIDQKEAILSFLNTNFLVVTGGPGTGKTTLIKMFVLIAKLYQQGILLAAPTGRAAKRLSEATWVTAKTIHRLLEWNPQTHKFKYNELDPLKQDIIIIDESSMIDIYLMNHLLNAIPQSTKVIFVGDSDQLPSVGPGNLLHDFINLFPNNVVRLKKIFRQALNSKITLNAYRINKKIGVNYHTNIDDDFIFCHASDYNNSYLDNILNLYPSIQILSPMQKGIYGVKALNNLIQNKVNPYHGQNRIVLPDKEFRVGDKVMQLVNNYDAKVYNGDMGIIKNIEAELIEILFDDLMVEYKIIDLDQIALAYAITIHKSQGSEYDYAVIFLMREQYIMLNKNLIYTAITRAKQKAIVVGHPDIITAAVKNKESHRISVLSTIQV